MPSAAAFSLEGLQNTICRPRGPRNGPTEWSEDVGASAGEDAG